MSKPGASSDDDVGVEVGAVLLGKYRIEAILGKGGMGIVARATHLHLDEQVAIKFLRRDTASDPEAAQRFLREAQASVKLKNEHVARVIDVGTLDGQIPYMVMEYLEGADLDLMLEQSGVVAPELAVDFILQSCAALSEAHAIGIVHRDIKPSNIFVTWRTDGSVLVKVLDFGISKIASGLTEISLTQTQSVLGTPAYMSPEQMRSARNVDARTDIWSLGTVLYELVQGHRPFEAESFSEMCVKVAVDPPLPLSNPLPPGLGDVIMTCLAKSPAERYQNVGALAAALAPFGRDPRAAQLMMERTQRTVARAPTPQPVRDVKSGPVVMPRVPSHTTERTPPPLHPGEWSGGASETGAPGMPGATGPGAPYPPKKTTPWAGAPVATSGTVTAPSSAVTTAAGSSPSHTVDTWNVPPTGVGHPAMRPSGSHRSTGRRIGIIGVVAVLTVAAVLIVLKMGGGGGSGGGASASSGSVENVQTGPGSGKATGSGSAVGASGGVGSGSAVGSGGGVGSSEGVGSGASVGSGSATGTGTGMGVGAGAGVGSGTSIGVGVGVGSGHAIGIGTGSGSGSGKGKRTGKRTSKRNGKTNDDDVFGQRK